MHAVYTCTTEHARLLADLFIPTCTVKQATDCTNQNRTQTSQSYHGIFALRVSFLEASFLFSCSLFSLATFFLHSMRSQLAPCGKCSTWALGNGQLGGHALLQPAQNGQACIQGRSGAHCFAICFIFASSTSGGIRDSAARSRQACIFSSASDRFSLR